MLKRNSTGFTLLESMIVVAILAITAAIAMPSLSSLLANFRIRSNAEAMLNGLKLSRAEAVRLNTKVIFTRNGSGWTIAVVSPARTLQSRPASESGSGVSVTSLNSQDSVVFRPDGRVDNFSATTNLSRLELKSGTANTDVLRVNLQAGGLVQMCNAAITTTNDPRRCP